ncbi:hypothetical protein JGH11_14580 [Dysgonomonas sp. Marseille-P4677]|uniref:hypothetical protein n=1 Tax=Dysgonomonas sp. Marseille-P4677 TaxID=2364790 RepID=UPI001912F7FD|nr:hypothetical protein [Dysgonomonas sp. Marseille-P4677]MBK5722101.1 hypothetical protein [Dysgonomonas sp. Marseille-P4677]
MKKNYFGILLGAILLNTLLFSSCSQGQNKRRENGWYHILDNRKDSVSIEPIVAVKDFVALKLDSGEISGQPFYTIEGKISKHKLIKWGDATEKSIGKRIGFVYDNEVVTCPQINMRLESGHFSISNPAYDIKKLFYKILQEKMDSISDLFPDWDRDPLSYSFSKNEIDSIIMEMDYWEASELKDIVTNPLDHYWYGGPDTVEYKNLEEALREELQKPSLSSRSEDYMKSTAYRNYKTYIYENPDYINLMFQGFLFSESPKGLYGYLIDDIIKNKYPQAPTIREYIEKTDNSNDELFAILQWQKRIWQLMNQEKNNSE